MGGGTTTYYSIPLLPPRFRVGGYALIALGFGAAYLYFWGGRPAFFEIPVFALLTSYVETRWFVIAQTNILDEAAIAGTLSGLLLILFSKEKQELPELARLRIQSVFYAVFITSFLLILLDLTIFGLPIIPILSSSFILFLVISIATFKVLLMKFHHDRSRSEITEQLKRTKS